MKTRTNHGAEITLGITETQAVDLPQIVRHLRSVLEYAERETCLHEETHRGGSIWEICDSCGMKWADDEGGKPDGVHDFPKVLSDARDFLSSMPNVKSIYPEPKP